MGLLSEQGQHYTVFAVFHLLFYSLVIIVGEFFILVDHFGFCCLEAFSAVGSLLKPSMRLMNKNGTIEYSHYPLAIR